MEWILKPFDELLPRELYAIMRLRNEVFVLEQQCLFQDADNKDQEAYHLMAWDNGELVAYTRLFPKGNYYDEASIGRVVTSPTVRNSGIGKKLMEKSIESMASLWGDQPIRIGAQCYLIQFYRKFHFVPEGEIYLEDGIEHIHMVRP